MKVIRKDAVLMEKAMESLRLEKDILNRIDHPFLVKMDYVFQSEHRVYFLMKFVKGGELFRHFLQVKRFSEDVVVFFGA
jgi:serine/threonine protein kinase